MKKLILTVFAATAVAAFQASAITVTVDHVAGYYASDGEFNVTPVTGVGYSALDLYKNNAGTVGFGTFCINANVGLSAIPGTYNATVIQSGIDPNNGNQISLGTAWLFQQFASGTLAGYNYTQVVVPNQTPLSGRALSAYYLQLAIWVLEGQYGGYGSVDNGFGNNPFLHLVVNTIGNGTTLASVEGDNNQHYGVGVLGLTSLNGQAAQPLLTLLPDGGSVLLLLGAGLSGLALVSRKLRTA